MTEKEVLRRFRRSLVITRRYGVTRLWFVVDCQSFELVDDCGVKAQAEERCKWFRKMFVVAMRNMLRSRS